MKTMQILGIIAAAGVAASAAAQDSVSNNNLGDAIDAYDASRQVTKFTVDLSSITSSKGAEFGVAPLLKSSRSSDPATTGFFSIRLSGQAISRNIESNVLASGSYATWNTAGAGVGPNNSAGTDVALPGSGLQSLAVGFNEFEPNNPNNTDNLVAGLVTFDPTNRNRLFVDRIIAATNAPDATTAGAASFGMGSIDTRLNLTSRADGFNVTSPVELVNQNIFRINADLRSNGVVNNIDRNVLGDPASTERVFDGQVGGFTTSTLSVAGAIPELNGGPTTFGPAFGAQLAINDHTAGTNAHFTPTFPGFATNVTDHRGGVTFNPDTALGGVGLAAQLQRDDTGNTVYLGVFGVDATGAPQQVANLQAPLTIQDPLDNYDAVGVPFGEFRHYRSQMAFSGPVGAASAGTDADGNVLVAGVFDVACNNCVVPGTIPTPVTYGNGGANVPTNAIAVARFNPNAADPSSTIEWTSAAWVNFDTGFGKPIRDAAGAEIGFLVPLNAFAGLNGPSISAPAMDSAGNLYFTSPFIDYGPDGLLGTADDDIDTGLFRAIYDAATFSYDLDVILQTGDVIASQGTGLNYNIGLIRVADNNSTDSSAFFGESATYANYPGTNPTSPADADNLGALVAAVNITYDVNGDGNFDFGFGTGDEDYSTLFYVSPLGSGDPITDCNGNGVDDATDIADGTSNDVNADGIPDECQLTRLCADTNNDGFVTPADFNAWILNFNNQNYRADQNADGLVTPADFNAWILNFNLGANGPLCVE
jgi:hypothetical protein